MHDLDADDLLADATPIPNPSGSAAVEALQRLGLKSVADWRWLEPDNEAPPLRTLLRQRDGAAFLPQGIVAMLASPGGTGKSWALVQLAVSIASGKDWLATYPVTEPGHVLMLMGEEDPDELHRRVRETVRAIGWTQTVEGASRRLHAASLSGQRAAMTDDRGEPTEWVDQLARAIESWPGVDAWRLIILDPASRFMGAEAETNNAQATRFVEQLERLTKIKGRPTVLVAHHTNKGALAGQTDQGAARGASALVDGVRWQANLDRVLDESAGGKPKAKPNEVELRLVKRNHVPAAPDLRLQRGAGGFLSPCGHPTPREPEPARATSKGTTTKRKFF